VDDDNQRFYKNNEHAIEKIMENMVDWVLFATFWCSETVAEADDCAEEDEEFDMYWTNPPLSSDVVVVACGAEVVAATVISGSAATL
jgi:16S rRNA G1207 methylase RsmC